MGGTTNSAAQGSVASDRAALVALYNATGGSNWTDNTNWLSAAPLGDWFGVETDGDGRVTELSLGGWDEVQQDIVGNGLTGTLPIELGTLAHLRRLEMEGNSLTGPIPVELANLISIPPELGRLTTLRNLNLWNVQLSGRIPPELGGMTSLERLNLFTNDLTGPVPPDLGNLANLVHMNLGRNRLTRIPRELTNLPRLENLFLHNNALTGPIPTVVTR